ncbi:LacI family DNA-binding transcriptional regulator, partial [uncultured Metabacillus sp.]|uniref:LacI family DNA-binding transcriptional regulator n=1 Tax=uncultured Metabacillus sp. TaxID=2860135 RepID=UPI0026259220
MATISDVAKLSGLSKTTVSRVINNHPYVSDKKKELVLNAMKELGYTPNPSARRLRGQLMIIAVEMSHLCGVLSQSLRRKEPPFA